MEKQQKSHTDDDDEVEIRNNYVKNELLEAAKNYIKENCNEKGEDLSSHEKTHSESASVKILPSAVIEVEKIVEGEMAKDAGIILNILDNLTVEPPEKFSVESVERSGVIIKANTLSDKKVKLNTAIILSCPFCEFTFTDVDNLKEHIEHNHLDYKGRTKT